MRFSSYDLLIALFACAFLCSSSTRAEFIKGVDLSTLKAAQDGGVQYKIDGRVEDPLLIFKRSGCNYVRLRLFVDPPGKGAQVNSLAYTLALAKRVKQAHLSLLLDFHYSDGWADPQHQSIPAAWVALPHDELARKVHDYTLATLRTFEANGCLPDMVAVGNEITNGMLFPDGGPLSSEAKWNSLIDLLHAGIKAAREAAPPSRLQVMIHIDRGAVGGVSEWFFSHCDKVHLDFDVIGLSYYPFWNGSFENLKKNLSALSQKYGRDIIVAETSNSYCGEQGKLPYPATPAGQKEFLEALMKIVSETPGGHGKGIFYWEPAFIEHSRWNGPDWEQWEGRALFDAQGNALPALTAFGFEPANGPQD